MSYTITTDVFCDGCGQWVHGACGRRILKKSAKKNAERQGWITVGRSHYCPSCSKKK